MGAVSPNEQCAIDYTPIDILRFLLGRRDKKACHSFSCEQDSACRPNVEVTYGNVLVVVDSIFRLTGGGERDPSLVLELRFKSFGMAISTAYLRRHNRVPWR